MFWAQPKAPSQILLPHLKVHRGPKVRCLCQVCGWICSYCMRSLEGLLFKRPKPSLQQKLKDRSSIMTRKIDTIGFKPGNLVLVKADAFQGKRKIMDRWEDMPHEVVHQIAWQMSPHMKWKTSMGIHTFYITTGSSSLDQKLVFACMFGCPPQYGTDVPVPPQSSILLRGSDSKTMPQDDNVLVII